MSDPSFTFRIVQVFVSL